MCQSDLSSLSPTPLQPVGGRSRAVAAVEFVHQIESIQLANVEFCADSNKLLYEMQIFLYHEPNRIPSNQSKRFTRRVTGSSKEEPDLRVKKSFSEFAALRDELLDLCKRSEYVWCEHCNRLFRYLLVGAKQPNALTKAITSNRSKLLIRARQQLLKVFMTRLVEMVRASDPSNPERESFYHPTCLGAEQVPLLLDAFLRQEMTQ